MCWLAANWIALANLIISAITLYFLIVYVRATKTIAQQSINQVEATFWPAIVIVPGDLVSESPRIVNIGKGPALGVQWSMPSSVDLQGVFTYLRPEEPRNLGFHGKFLYEGDGGVVSCHYTSVSGKKYSSISRFDAHKNVFSTTFNQ